MILACLIYITGCTNKNSNNIFETQSHIDDELNTDSKIDDKKYVDDEVINKYITVYNSFSTSQISEIKKGNIRTKYSGMISGYLIEMINANETIAGYFGITINGGNTETDLDNIISIYRDSIKTIDSTISDNTIEETIQKIKNSSVMISEYDITENIKINYFPISELSYGKSKCIIEIHAYNFK